MDWQIDRFAEHRTRLRAVAYRMLGSLSEADDAVQETWLRLARTDTSDVTNLAGWLTTVLARVCLNMLRGRTTRREESLDVHVPDPIVTRPDDDPEQEAVLADSVGLALLVVLDMLTPAERVAFVLHDMFAVPFEDIAAMLDRSPAATRQLASRARRRVQGAPTPDGDLAQQRAVVDAFFAASRKGDFEALVSVLDPDIVLRSDGGALTRMSMVLHGPDAVTQQARGGAKWGQFLQPAMINGSPGVVVATDRKIMSIMAFTVVRGKIVEIDVLADPARLAAIPGYAGR